MISPAMSDSCGCPTTPTPHSCTPGEVCFGSLDYSERQLRKQIQASSPGWISLIVVDVSSPGSLEVLPLICKLGLYPQLLCVTLSWDRQDGHVDWKWLLPVSW